MRPLRTPQHCVRRGAHSGTAPQRRRFPALALAADESNNRTTPEDAGTGDPLGAGSIQSERERGNENNISTWVWIALHVRVLVVQRGALRNVQEVPRHRQSPTERFSKATLRRRRRHLLDFPVFSCAFVGFLRSARRRNRVAIPRGLLASGSRGRLQNLPPPAASGILSGRPSPSRSRSGDVLIVCDHLLCGLGAECLPGRLLS